MPNVRASSGMMGTTRRPIWGMLHQQGQDADERHGAGNLAPGRSLQRLLHVFERRGFDGAGLRLAKRHIPAQLTPALVQISHFRAVRGRPVERRVVRGFFRNGNLEARTEMRDLRLVELLLLVGDIAAFAGLAQPVPLDGLGQDQRRQPLGLDGLLVGVKRPSAGRGRRAAGETAPRRSGGPPGRAVAGTCRKSSCGCKRRPW